MIQSAKIIRTGVATTRLTGAGIGIGVAFGALILGVARNPSLRGQLFVYNIRTTTTKISVNLKLHTITSFNIPVTILCPICSGNNVDIWILSGSRCPSCGVLIN